MNLKIIFVAVFISIISNCSLADESNDSSTIQYKDDGLDLKENVRFFLYRRKTKNNPEQLYADDKDTLEKSVYDASLPTKFVTHGWKADYTSDNCATVVQALLMHDDYNVIAVDWATVASQKYKNSASRVRVIGKYVGKMIKFVQEQGASLKNMSLIGHSMGAHIMGFAGKSMPNEKVNHIVGLDPAGAGFEQLDVYNQLFRDDAENVQAIHTNAGQLGTKRLVGYSDFYPNGGGPTQPSCPDDDGGKCAHSRSYMYYVESLKDPESWYAIDCLNYKEFSEGKCKDHEVKPFPRWSGSFKARLRNYMLRTNSESPYGLGINGTVSIAELERDPPIQYEDDGFNQKKYVQFYLYTRKNKNNPQQLYDNDKNALEKSDYDASLPAKFVTHGWNGSYTSDSCAAVVQALLNHDSYNVIAVDWKKIANTKYLSAASRVRVIGNYVGKMIAFLNDQGTDFLDMSLIGHGMGAHIMGFAGKHVRIKMSLTVEHIVGLDPSGRGFEYVDADDRLNIDDAENVQVIHTNMGQRGISQHVGYSDFYPNGGGPNQPGCPEDDEGYCAHYRSYKYYVESIQNPKSWYCIDCPSYDDFNKEKCKYNEVSLFPRWSGELKAKLTDYMLRTNSQSPYGLKRAGTQPMK